MIRWTGLAPWEFEFPFPGSLTSTFLVVEAGSAPGSSAGSRGGRRASRAETSPLQDQTPSHPVSEKVTLLASDLTGK